MRTIGEWLRRIAYLINGRRNERDLRDEMEAHRAEMGEPVAVAVMVLVAAAVFLDIFRDTQTTDAGFEREGVLMAGYDLSFGGPLVPGGAEGRKFTVGFANLFLERLRALPDVEAASIGLYVPLEIHGMPLRDFVLEGRARTDGGRDQALMNIVTADYFRTMGIPFVEGSDFSNITARPDPSEVIVNEAFVRRFLDGAKPVGRRVQTRGAEPVIVGVVADSVYEWFDEPPIPMIYHSFGANPLSSAEIHLKTRTGSEILLGPEVRRTVREIRPTMPLYNMRTLTEHVDTNLFLQKIPARIFAVLGPILLLLVAVGIYAVVSFTVARRTREIGIRLALGAESRTVVAQIIMQTMTVILYGTIVGWFMAFVPQIHLAAGEPLNKMAFFGAPVLLLGVATLSCWLPARRAIRVGPMSTLRED